MSDDFILISGLQHLLFCPRQWALIHIDRQWQENYFTAMGRVLHEKAHSEQSESRPGLVVARGLSLRSERLMICGVADVVEFHQDEDGVSLPGHRGRWRPFPVEYKNGRPKTKDCDRIQLCAQAVCLEEMLGCAIPAGALFYGTTRRRENVEFSAELRRQLEETVQRAHELLESGTIPAPQPDKHCKSCSIADVCQPKKTAAVSDYLQRHIREALDETPSQYALHQS